MKSLHQPEQIVSEECGPVVWTDGFRLEGSSMHGVERCGVLDDNEWKISTHTDYELSQNEIDLRITDSLFWLIQMLSREAYSQMLLNIPSWYLTVLSTVEDL